MNDNITEENHSKTVVGKTLQYFTSCGNSVMTPLVRRKCREWFSFPKISEARDSCLAASAVIFPFLSQVWKAYLKINSYLFLLVLLIIYIQKPYMIDVFLTRDLWIIMNSYWFISCKMTHSWNSV